LEAEIGRIAVPGQPRWKKLVGFLLLEKTLVWWHVCHTNNVGKSFRLAFAKSETCLQK
jgi:hypothetical protein